MCTFPWRRVLILTLLSMLSWGAGAGAVAQEAEEAAAEGHEAETPWFRVGSVRTWIFRSFLKDETNDATTLGLEAESYLTFGSTQIKNIAYLEVADHPRAIPGQPQGNPVPEPGAATGISDLLTGFWFSKKGPHHGRHHFAPGLAAQLPTASDATLGSGKWSLGPSFDYEYESGSLFAGAIALQIWSVAGDSDRKDVSMLMIKPFVYYSLSEHWDLMYVPYGISVYWNKPSGEKAYVPIGGGGQWKTHLGSLGMNVGLQLFNNVVRPSKGTVWDLRVLVELVF
jgi:hypothetical protein